MAKLNMYWPPENTLKYEFREDKDLDLEIPLVNGKNIEKGIKNSSKSNEKEI